MIKRVLNETLIYGVGNALSRFCALLIFPVYAKLLTKAEFAQQDLVLATAAIASLIAGLGIDSGYSRLFYDGEEGRADLATTWGVFSIIITIPLILSTLLLRDPIALWLIDDQSASELLLWGFVGVIFQILQRQSVLTIRLRRQATRFVVVSIFGALSQLLLAVWFVRYLNWGGLGVLRSYAGASLISFFVSIIASGWIWRGRFSWTALKGMLAFGLPLLPAAAATWSLDFLNRFILQHVSGPAETAIFGVGMKTVALLGVVFFGFQMAWAPFAFSLMKNPKHASEVYAEVARWLWLVGGVAVFTLSLFSKEIILLLTKEEYLPAAELVPMLGMAALLWSFFYIICVGFQYAKKTHHQMVAMFLGLVGLALVGWLTIRNFGAIGAAAGTLVGYLIAIIYGNKASSRYLSVDYPWSKIMLWAGTIFVFGYGLCSLLPYASSLEMTVANLWPLFVKAACAFLLASYGFWLLVEPQSREKVFLALREQLGRGRAFSFGGK